jgi:hypothetical protein
MTRGGRPLRSQRHRGNRERLDPDVRRLPAGGPDVAARAPERRRCRRSSSTSPTASATSCACATSRSTATSRARLRGGARRPARLGRLRRLLPTSTPAGARDAPRGHRLDRRPAVVRRQRRHDRHLLGRLQRLQVAALRPPALKAIITLCSTDDRYADDVHYMGGCLLNENAAWGSIHAELAFVPAARPGDRRRALARAWRERLERTSRSHRPGCATSGATTTGSTARSARTTPPSRCPVYAIGGWADGYTNAVPACWRGSGAAQGADRPLGARLPARRGARAAEIGFLQEALRWWDHWLKGIDTGIMDEPMLRVWMQE